MVVLIAALLLGGPLPSTPYGPADHKAWSRLLNRDCPTHMIQEWIATGVESGLLDRYAATLPARERATYRRLARVGAVCGVSFRMGQSCDIIVKRHALREMGLLGSMAKYACAHAVCTETAVCDAPKRARR